MDETLSNCNDRNATTNVDVADVTQTNNEGTSDNDAGAGIRRNLKKFNAQNIKAFNIH